jgi:branched-chain amino acid transport system ATP-binding protein
MRRGEIWLRGTPIHTLPTHRAAREGIALVPEDRRIVAGLTVEENLRLAQVAPGRGWSLDRIYERFPRLAERRRQDGTTLSGGEQQMLAIARALGRDLSLLLLDEPYEGLAPHIVQEIETIMAALKHDGLTVLLVEQNAVAALRIADRVAILDDGRVVFDGAPSDVLGDDGLRRALLAV